MRQDTVMGWNKITAKQVVISYPAKIDQLRRQRKIEVTQLTSKLSETKKLLETKREQLTGLPNRLTAAQQTLESYDTARNQMEAANRGKAWYEDREPLTKFTPITDHDYRNASETVRGASKLQETLTSEVGRLLELVSPLEQRLEELMPKKPRKQP